MSGERNEDQAIYQPSEVATFLEVSVTSLRRYATAYEQVHGEMPRDPQGRRLWTQAAVSALQGAKALLDRGEVVSVRAALERSARGGSETETVTPPASPATPTSSTSPRSGSSDSPAHPYPLTRSEADRELIAALLDEVRQLRGQLDTVKEADPRVPLLVEMNEKLERKRDELSEENTRLLIELERAKSSVEERPNRVRNALNQLLEWFRGN